ncbi:MAG TPA: cytosine permease [Solirubrobacteraceae bacterium]|nr:cytosine permease [Solirubrobacteraceae bacterium]
MSAVLAPERVVVDGGLVSEEPVFEQRGIDYIPVTERRGRPIDLAWMWAGALFNVEYVVYGALLVVATGFGLRFWQAAVIILVGNLSYLITGLGSLQGPRAGTAAFTINRAPFGPNGAKLIAMFNWVTQVGYEVVGLALVVAAGLALLGKAGVASSAGLKIVLIAAAASIQLLLPLFGHRAMLRVLRMLVPPFVVLFVILAILALPKAHLGAGHDASWAMMMAGLAFVLSSGGYGWTMNANDFSRYLPADASPRKIVWSVALGGYIPTTLLLLLGAAVATAVPAASDPISGLPHAFAGWFIWPYLAFVIVQLFAINSIDLYSSGLTLQAIIPRIKRWQCVLLDTTVAGALTAFTVFSSGFNTFLTDFLLFMLIWIAPWVAIYLTDYFMRRGRYDARSLMDTRAGLYFRNAGVHVPGVVAQLVGMVAAAMWLNAYPAWTSPLSTHTGGADFSVFVGALFGAGTYYLLARRSVPGEAKVSVTDAAAPAPGAGELGRAFAS